MDEQSLSWRERIAQDLVLVEFGGIVALLWALSLEYGGNQFFQTWISENMWPMSLFLNGTFAAILLGVFVSLVALRIRRALSKYRLRRVS